MKTIQLSDAAAERLATIGLEGVIATLSSHDNCSCRPSCREDLDRCSTPRIGKFWRGGVYAGVAVDRNGCMFDLEVITDRDLKPILLDKTEFGCYGTEVADASHFTDGMANCEALAKAGSPLALAVRGKCFQGLSDCYIPAIGEMNIIRANCPDLLPKDAFWSSTQGARYYARFQGFETGLSYWGNKDYKIACFVVRRVYR